MKNPSLICVDRHYIFAQSLQSSSKRMFIIAITYNHRYHFSICSLLDAILLYQVRQLRALITVIQGRCLGDLIANSAKHQHRHHERSWNVILLLILKHIHLCATLEDPCLVVRLLKILSRAILLAILLDLDQLVC